MGNKPGLLSALVSSVPKRFAYPLHRDVPRSAARGDQLEMSGFRHPVDMDPVARSLHSLAIVGRHHRGDDRVVAPVDEILREPKGCEARDRRLGEMTVCQLRADFGSAAVLDLTGKLEVRKPAEADDRGDGQRAIRMELARSRKPRAASIVQKASSHQIIEPARPIMRSTGGSPGLPKDSVQSSTPPASMNRSPATAIRR